MKKLIFLITVLCIVDTQAAGLEVAVVNPQARALIAIPKLLITPKEMLRVHTNTLMIKAIARHAKVDPTMLAVAQNNLSSFSKAIFSLLGRTQYAQEARVRVMNLPEIRTDIPINSIEMSAYEKIVNDELDLIFVHDIPLASDFKKLCTEYGIQ